MKTPTKRLVSLFLRQPFFPRENPIGILFLAFPLHPFLRCHVLVFIQIQDSDRIEIDGTGPARFWMQVSF